MTEPPQVKARGARGPLIAAGVSALALLLLGIYGPGLAGGFAMLLLPGAAFVLLAVIVVAAVAVSLLVRRRRWMALGVSLAMLAPGAILVGTFFPAQDTHLRLRFAMQRPLYDLAAAKARRGDLEGLDEYYGATLPPYLCTVSLMCQVSTIGTSNGHPVLFAPVMVGVPDDAVGFGHFVGAPENGTYDGYGMLVCPIFHVGGGWWWMDNRQRC
jgi:hypothetical protein